MAEDQSVVLSIVMPVFNDAASADLFLPNLYPVMQSQEGQCEIILVDDGSQNNLQALFQKHLHLLPENTILRVVTFSRNFGKEAALSAGLEHSQGDAVVLMDSDGQHPVSILIELLSMYHSGEFDMIGTIQGTREHENSFLRYMKNTFYRIMRDTHRYQITPNAGDFRIMSRKVVDALLKLPERQRFMKGLYAWVGFKTAYIPFQAEIRNEGESKFNYTKLFELALVAITSFSQRPLHWISRMGLLISIVSFLYGIYIIVDTLIFGKEISGWATLAAGIMLSAGVQLICVGVIGEYIGRIYEEVKQRPLYIIDQVWNSNEQLKQ